MTRAALAWSLLCISLFAAACGGDRSADGRGRCGSLDWAPWRAPGSTEGHAPTTRQRIADEAMRCRALRGRSRADVQRLLGPPDQGQRGASRWHWLTGEARGVPIDAESLVVSFVDGRVHRVTLEVG